MKKLFYNVILVCVCFSFIACASKEFNTSKYYEKFTKDEILYAGKLAFSETPNEDFIIDSYRDKLEVTNIRVIFNILYHDDYILEVKEDDCGTDVNLTVKSNYGPRKSDEKYLLESTHTDIWSRIDFFLGKNNSATNLTRKVDHSKVISDGITPNINNKRIMPTKDLSNCVINNEFDKGVIKDIIKQENE